ncbi:MAG: endopeptidase La [Nitrospira sp.]|nr:endopeptidase La [Nitrospira sp.]
MAEIDTLEDRDIEIPTTLPILPVRDVVIFPYMILPLFVGRDMSIKAIERAAGENKLILLVSQKDINVENPTKEDLYKVGTVGTILRMLKLPDGRLKILVQGLTKAKITEFSQTEPYYIGNIEKIVDIEDVEMSLEIEALMRNVKELVDKSLALGKSFLPDIIVLIENIEEPGRLADLVASNLGLKADQAQELLEEEDPLERLKKISEILNREVELLLVQQKIQSDVKGEIDKTQREYFLREQLKAIQKELGEIDEKTEEIMDLREKIEKAKMPEKVEKEAIKQINRLEKMHPDSAEAGTIRTYVDWLIELPWSKSTKDKLDIKRAKKILDEDHYDLEKVKERILEYLGVRKLKDKMKGPILCFVGPPGVGKTSLGKSIARAMGREFYRMSLGGMRDEAEIRGHRRTYVGAMPGRVIQGIKTSGNNNPVFMLDEIDKIGMDFRGDPASALLEVLDPEQNFAFGDHYLGVPFDLSNVMFITTANQMDTIPSPLRDRMEVLYLSGYTAEEKVGIAKNYLIPKQLDEHGINEKNIKINDDALLQVITHYTIEAGVRNLEREIAHLCRKVARKTAEGQVKKYVIAEKNLSKYLGVPKFLPEEEIKKDEIGLATGLAWTEAGGDIIYIEATIMRGKGGLTLTGQLGDVMQESAHAARSYIRSKAKSLGISNSMFSNNDIHIHVPAGAIPKDGPSAGITLATALASVFSGKAVRKSIAMTGEVTLRGSVLPIGGLKEKTLAAKRMGIHTVIIPKRNEKDLEDIPKYIKKDMKFIPVETMDEVLKHALKPKAKVKAKPKVKAKTKPTTKAKAKAKPKAKVKAKAKSKKRTR